MLPASSPSVYSDPGFTHSVRPIDIVLNYRQGLSIKPLTMASR